MEKLKVLYIEDEEAIRQFNTLLIQKFCPETVAVSNAADGLRQYKKTFFDIIITDIDMPGLSGLDFIKRVRESNERVRVLITTAYTDKDYLFEAIELRLTKYLEKPIDEKKLQKALQQCALELKKQQSPSEDLDLGSNYSYRKRSKTLLKDSEIIPLKKRETLLLHLLVSHIECVVEYDQIARVVWEEREMTSNALRSTIKDLRKKLADGMLANVSGLGYKLTKI